MSKTYISFFSSIVLLSVLTAFYAWSKAPIMFTKNLRSFEDVKALFPTTPAQIKKDTNQYLQQAQKELAAILAVPDAERTFDNTARAVDELESLSNIAVKYNTIELIGYVHPDDAMRKVAHEASQQIKEFFIDMGANKKLYKSFKAYA